MQPALEYFSKITAFITETHKHYKSITFFLNIPTVNSGSINYFTDQGMWFPELLSQLKTSTNILQALWYRSDVILWFVRRNERGAVSGSISMSYYLYIKHFKWLILNPFYILLKERIEPLYVFPHCYVLKICF